MWASRTSSKFTYEQTTTETKHQVNVATGKISSLTTAEQSESKCREECALLPPITETLLEGYYIHRSTVRRREERNLCVQQLCIRHSDEDKHALGTVSDLRKFISFHYSFSKYLLSTYYVHIGTCSRH